MPPRRTAVATVGAAGFLTVAGIAGASVAASPAPAATDGGAAATATVGAVTARASEDPGSVEIREGRLTVLRVEARVGDPLERQPEFAARVPSYRRAIDMDRDQRWVEAEALYQQAVVEVAAAARLPGNLSIERAVFKIDFERRLSRALVEPPSPDGRGLRAPSSGPRPPSATAARMAALERGRMLRLKMMAVRAATGAVPAGLATATLRHLDQALRESDRAATDRTDDDRESVGPRPGGDPEIRLLMCATRAVAGDRTGARLQLAHVSSRDREDPARALALAACQAALGYRDQALGSLAVAADRQGPSLRFLPAQAHELESSNDWDTLRSDPRFDHIFR